MLVYINRKPVDFDEKREYSIFNTAKGRVALTFTKIDMPEVMKMLSDENAGLDTAKKRGSVDYGITSSAITLDNGTDEEIIANRDIIFPDISAEEVRASLPKVRNTLEVMRRVMELYEE